MVVRNLPNDAIGVGHVPRWPTKAIAIERSGGVEILSGKGEKMYALVHVASVARAADLDQPTGDDGS